MTRPAIRSPRTLTGVVIALVLAASLSGCGERSTSSSPSEPNPETAQAEPGNDPQATDQQAHDHDAAVEYPRRIVSLSASLTEMLFAVGADDQVVAVDQYSNYPEGTPITDLSGFRPNVEAIAGFEPDLVLLPSDRDGVVEALEAAGIATLVLPSASSIEDALDQLLVVADTTGHREAGLALIEELQAGLDELAAATRGAPTLTYYYELSDSHHSATSDSFIGSLLALIGLESIADGVDPEAGKFPQLTAEHIFASDPDLILIGGAGTVRASSSSIAGRPGWEQLQAVRNERVIELDEDRSSRWGPRIVEFLAEVADAVAATGAR